MSFTDIFTHMICFFRHTIIHQLFITIVVIIVVTVVVE